MHHNYNVHLCMCLTVYVYIEKPSVHSIETFVEDKKKNSLNVWHTHSPKYKVQRFLKAYQPQWLRKLKIYTTSTYIYSTCACYIYNVHVHLHVHLLAVYDVCFFLESLEEETKSFLKQKDEWKWVLPTPPLYLHTLLEICVRVHGGKARQVVRIFCWWVLTVLSRDHWLVWPPPWIFVMWSTAVGLGGFLPQPYLSLLLGSWRIILVLLPLVGQEFCIVVWALLPSFIFPPFLPPPFPPPPPLPLPPSPPPPPLPPSPSPPPLPLPLPLSPPLLPVKA